MKRKDIIKKRRLEKRNKGLYKVTLMASLLSAPATILNSNIDLNTQLFNNETLEAQAMSPSEFILKIGEFARTIAAKNDLYASVMIAQAALESGWGGSGLASAPHHNLFGIKGDYNGKSYYVKTLEDDGKGNYYEIMDNFRSYPSYAESLQDYANVLTGANSAWLKSYYLGARASQTNHFSEATRHLTGRYATDTRYGSKLNDIIYSYNLTRYDSYGLSTQDKNPVVNNNPNHNNYTVKNGDSLYKIAMENNVSVDELLKLNNLSLNSIIHPNQKLILSKSVANKPTPTPTIKPEPKPAAGSNIKSSYSVKPGDSLYKIATDNNISIDELLKNNNLTLNSVIHPNQTLILNKKIAEVKPAPAPTPKPDPSNTQTNNKYKVKPGDGLYKISESLGINLNTLLKLNNLTLNSVIHPNQELKLPSDSKTETVKQPVINTGNGKKSYVVKPGDSLYKIANDNNILINELLKNNNLTLNSVIHPGQNIVINKGVEKVKIKKITRTYTVKPGDGLQKIADIVGATLHDLMSQNNLTKDSIIHPAQKLVYNFTVRVDSTKQMSSEEMEELINDRIEKNKQDKSWLSVIESEDVIKNDADNEELQITEIDENSEINKTTEIKEVFEALEDTDNEGQSGIKDISKGAKAIELSEEKVGQEESVTTEPIDKVEIDIKNENTTVDIIDNGNEAVIETINDELYRDNINSDILDLEDINIDDILE